MINAMGEMACDCSTNFTDGVGVGIGVVLGLDLIVFLLVLGIMYYRSTHPREFTFEKDRERNPSQKQKFDSLGLTTLDKESQLPHDHEAMNTADQTRPNGTSKDIRNSDLVRPETDTNNTHMKYMQPSIPEPDSKKKISILPLNHYISPRSSKEHAILGDLGSGSGY